MARVIHIEAKKPLTDELLFGKLEHGGQVRVDEMEDKLCFTITSAEEEAAKALALAGAKMSDPAPTLQEAFLGQRHGAKRPAPMLPLPIDPLLPQIVDSLRENPNLVLRAEPGAGKTTRVPPALLKGVVPPHQQVVVLEPRRLAARMAARRVAEELGTTVGGVVGYQVRFEEAVSSATRLRFVTEGILVRQLLGDPQISTVGAVVLDEFHERHIHADLALALLRALQKSRRPDLKIVVMSATLDSGPVARFLGDCPQIDAPGRLFNVNISFAPWDEPTSGGRPLERQVVDALNHLVDAKLQGDVLVFLPGAAEIRRSFSACASLASKADLLVLPLHGDLSPEEQDLAVRPASRRKVILSTNVAETSVTIDGVGAIIDSGLARTASHASWSGLPVLKLSRISRASAAQRAGRAGRTRPGQCVRLYTRHDHDTRPEHTIPEIRRLDLAEPLLTLRGLGVTNLPEFPWFEPPERAQLEAADALLHRLHAVDDKGNITALGKQMLRFPLHPRQAAVLLSAAEQGLTREGCTLAAILGERDLWKENRSPLGGRKKREAHGSDVLAVMEAMARPSASEELDDGALHRVKRVASQLMSTARSLGPQQPNPPVDLPTVLGKAVLAGYPDRVAQRREHGRASTARRDVVELLLSTGGTARLAPWSCVQDDEWMVALDAELRREGAREEVTVLRASAIEPDWLLDVVPEALTEAVDVEWNANAQRADAFSRLRLGALVLSESQLGGQDVAEASAALEKAALAAGPSTFCDPDDLALMTARLQILRQIFPEADFPDVNDAFVADSLRGLCKGRRSFAELRDASLLAAMTASLTPEQARLLRSAAPESITLPGGRRCRVQYIAGQPPHVSSRLQDFFGMTETPRIMEGRVPLNLHLLAPNGREVQITNDLRGFWQRTYPAIRKELMRRYPKHAWPEDPVHASPPQPSRRH